MSNFLCRKTTLLASFIVCSISKVSQSFQWEMGGGMGRLMFRFLQSAARTLNLCSSYALAPSHTHRYLNDVYSLEVLEGTSLQWECPTIEGPTPSPRESHSSVTIGNKLLVYGGMNGKRLNDLWTLNIGEWSWEWPSCQLMSNVFLRGWNAVECSIYHRPCPPPSQPTLSRASTEPHVRVWWVGPCGR